MNNSLPCICECSLPSVHFFFATLFAQFRYDRLAAFYCRVLDVRRTLSRSLNFALFVPPFMYLDMFTADLSLPSTPTFLSIKSIEHASTSVFLDMKDITTASNRHTRNSLIYPKKRPSPHGISKAHRSPLLPAPGANRRTPRSIKATLIQRQREAQISALRREGVLLEEEYRDEIRYYMHDMEVSSVR